MASSLLFRYPVVFSIIVFYIFAVTSHALVITAPSWEGNGSRTAKERANAGTKIEPTDLDLRIRSTNEDDIREIATMLTYALLEDDDKGAANNKQQLFSPLNLNFRRTRIGVTSLLQSRMNSIKIGRKVLLDAKGTFENLTEADQLRLLWSNDAFRNNVEKAASLSNEPHIWSEHNFMCAPQSLDWLFHKMVTTENALTGEIIGYCEIAMLSQPSSGNSASSKSTMADASFLDEECSLVEQEGVPTIVNLVISTDYRRRGVASTIVNSAMRYVHKASSSGDEMALYVEEGNYRAIKMYERLGFQKRQRVNSKKQWYMTRQISSGVQNQISTTKDKGFR